VARFVFDYAKLGPGACGLRATVSDSSRKTLGTGELSCDIPEKPVWLGNDLGKADTVLPPWTPLRSGENSVEMWGRKYLFDGSPLPAQVVSQERRLLRSPIALTLRAGGTEAALKGQPRGKPEGNEAVVSRRWEGEIGPLACVVTSRVEFDGFMLLDCELKAAKAVEVDELKLVIPFGQDAATLYHHANASWTDLSDAGAIGAAGWSKPLPFVPYYWVGTEKGGLAWFCEHNQNWRNADASRAVELTHGKEGVSLTVRFIDQKTALAEPLRLTFGLMATPVKPLPAGWRDWRHFSISAINLESFVKQGWAAAGCRNIGHLWNNHVGSFSYLPAKPAEMREKVAFLHANGWPTVMSYYALDYTQVGTPDFRTMEREWRRSPYAESDCPGGSFGSVCNASTWADFLVWAVARTMDETGTDGAYLDCTSPSFCQSAEHGCAPGRYPLLATRELHKRIYAIAKQKRGPNGHVFSHISENNLITTFSFADAVLNGEQYNRKDLRTLTFDKFRAEFIPHSLGVPSVLLPTLIKFQPDKKEKMPGAEFLAFPLLHDVVCMHSWMGRESQELNKRMQAVLHDFGVADAEFLPYWDNAADLAVSPKGATVSGYLRKDGKAALLIAQGPETPGAFKLTLTGCLATLRGFPARNALTDQPLAWNNGQLTWPGLDKSVQLAIIGAR